MSNHKQKDASSWRTKAYHDKDFITSPDAREVRILCEITAPKLKYKEEQINNTIVFFGSARSVSQEEASKELADLQAQISNGSDKHDLQKQIDKALMKVKLAKYYDAAEDLAAKLTEWSMSILQKEKQIYICSGGGPGMMEAANKGAARVGGPSIGLNIALPFEQEPNAYQTPQLSYEFHYFFVRKFWFAYLAKALVVFPGGFGTMDELFELLTLIQTEKVVKPIPIVLFGREFWDDFMNTEALLKWGVISEADLDLFKIYDDVDECFNYLKHTISERFL